MLLNIPMHFYRHGYWTCSLLVCLWISWIGEAARAAEKNEAKESLAFRVATYNVFFKNTNLTSIVEALLEINADLVLLQETTTEIEKELTGKLGDRYPYVRFQVAPGSGGFGVLSRKPLVGLRYLTPEKGLRGALVGRVQWTSDLEIPFASVHLVTPKMNSDETLLQAPNMFARAGAIQEKEMRRILTELGDVRSKPAFIAGDFNSFSFEPAQVFLKDQGFLDSLQSVNPKADESPTWKGTKSGLNVSFRIDYIFHTTSIKTLESRVVAKGTSDHYPVTSLLEIQKP